MIMIMLTTHVILHMLYNILRLFLPLRYRRSSLTAVALGLAFSWLGFVCSRDLVGVIISVYYTFTSLLHYIILHNTT